MGFVVSQSAATKRRPLMAPAASETSQSSTGFRMSGRSIFDLSPIADQRRIGDAARNQDVDADAGAVQVGR